MDKRWMSEARYTTPYADGVAQFIQFAFTHSARGSTILCPCRNCYNCSWHEADVVREHLVCDGFVHGYTRWEFHGEATDPPNVDHIDVSEPVDEEADDLNKYDEMAGMIRDMRHAEGNFSDRRDDDEGRSDNGGDDSEALRLLAEYNSEELYPGSTGFSKLRFMVRLLHTKSMGGWSDKSFDMLLELLREVFPKGSKLPKNFHEAKKLVKCFSLDYVSIHACEHDCVLFWKNLKDVEVCPVCKTSRWKSIKKKPDGRHVHKVPRKVLRYFPITKRLQRLFITPKSATDCRWHDEGRTKDGLLRHPADSPAWKHFDSKHENFAADSRNIRLIIATDGFNPFRSMNCSYSIWPVIGIPLNLPPWLCMKQPNFMLSLLEKTLEQGDVLTHVLGKERHGHVRCIGMGPSAGKLGIPGGQKLKSTKLQMAEEETKEAWRVSDVLREHVEEIREECKSKIDGLQEEIVLLKWMMEQTIAANDKTKNIEREPEDIEREHEDSIGHSYAIEDQNDIDNDIDDAVERIEQEMRSAKERFQKKRAEVQLLQKRKEEQLLQKKKKEVELLQMKDPALNQKKEVALSQRMKDSEVHQKQQEARKKKDAEVRKRQPETFQKEAAVTQKNHQQRKEVILYNVFRDHTTPVAKATILSTDRKKMVGGRELGVECCEVVINYIIKRDALLPRPIGNVTTMGQAQGRSIAWLHKHMEEQKKFTDKPSAAPNEG